MFDDRSEQYVNEDDDVGSSLTPEQYEVLFGEPPPPTPSPLLPASTGPPPAPTGYVGPAPPSLASNDLPNADVGRGDVGRADERRWYRKKRYAIPTGLFGLIVAGTALSNLNAEPETTSTAAEVSESNDAETDEPPASTPSSTAATTLPQEAEMTSPTTELAATESSTPLAVVSESQVDAALDRLDEAIIVEVFDPGSPYQRDEYMPGGWGDSDGDCQSDRHEILIEESLEPVILDESGCRVETGEWVDPYDGTVLYSASEATIDHVVPLAAAHRAGGWAWDLTTKQAFAADITFHPSHAVTGAEANQAKGDREPDRWKPPLKDAWCSYAVDWISVKDRWQLSYTTAETEALRDMLTTCQPTSTSASSAATVPAPSIVTSTTTSSTTTTLVELVGPANVMVESCSRFDEVVVLVNRGGETSSMSGWLLHDDGRKHEFALGSITLGAGERISILTGSNATAAVGSIVWKKQNVWNNDGDTAFILNASATIISQQRC